jgi:Domain of unknown function (DUF4437)
MEDNMSARCREATEGVSFLDTNAMDWTPGVLPGLFTKILRFDPATGARTALQCIDPGRGYVAPLKPHYHKGDEEILLVKGRFTFDGINWLQRYSYCFHPAGTVHGFSSAVAEESWFISRFNRPFDMTDIEARPGDRPYSITGTDPARAIASVLDPLAGGWDKSEAGSGKSAAEIFILSQHPLSHEGSALLRLPPGWESENTSRIIQSYIEFFVMEGEVVSEDGRTFSANCYCYTPASTILPPLVSRLGATVYVNFGTFDELHAVLDPTVFATA